jgi:hypothetical protein
MASHGEFDTCKNRYYNSQTRKWVVRLRQSKINARWQQLGCPRKRIQIPIGLDIEKLKQQSEKLNLNHEYLLFVFHKLLYNRLRGKQMGFENESEFVQVSSLELKKWLGKKYKTFVDALISFGYLLPKLSAAGNASYWRAANKEDSILASFRINPELFAYDLFEQKPCFKSYQLTDLRLNCKLQEQFILHKSDEPNELHELLTKALSTVKVDTGAMLADSKLAWEGKQQVMLFVEQINNGDIYVKPDFDSYGERFHSIFTFTWSGIRPYIYFNDSPKSPCTYLDLRNSQYFFFSLLKYQRIYEVIPEYKFMHGIIMKLLQEHSALSDFMLHSQNGTLYKFVGDNYALNKLTLMKWFFAASRQYKKSRSSKLPWLQSLISQLETKHGRNILPEVLQKIESRIVLGKIAYHFLRANSEAGLITIHDGIIVPEMYARYLDEVLHHVFAELELPVPAFKKEVFVR